VLGLWLGPQNPHIRILLMACIMLLRTGTDRLKMQTLTYLFCKLSVECKYWPKPVYISDRFMKFIIVV